MGFDQEFFECLDRDPNWEYEENHNNVMAFRNDFDLHELLFDHDLIETVNACAHCSEKECKWKAICKVNIEKLKLFALELENKIKQDEIHLIDMINELDTLLNIPQEEYTLKIDKLKNIHSILKRQYFLSENKEKEQELLDNISFLATFQELYYKYG